MNLFDIINITPEFLREYEGKTINFNSVGYRIQGGQITQTQPVRRTTTNENNVFNLERTPPVDQYSFNTVRGLEPVIKTNGGWKIKDAYRYIKPEFIPQDLKITNFGVDTKNLGTTLFQEAFKKAIASGMTPEQALQNINSDGTTRTPTTNGQPVPGLPEALNQKLYDATGRVMPTAEDYANYQYNPGLFEKQLDDMIKQKQIESTTAQNEATNKQVQSNIQSGAQVNWKGDYALVKFVEDPDGSGPQNTSTLFLVDRVSKTLRPFLSETAFNTLYSSTGKTLKDFSVTPISLTQLNEGQGLAGFTQLPNENGYKDDGTFVQEDTSNSNKVGATYGKARDVNAEQEAVKAVDQILDKAKADGGLGVSAEILDAIANDPDKVGFYANAIAYGEYSVSDILRDLKRKQLVKNGDTSLSGLKLINDTVIAPKYYTTPEGTTAKANSALILPTTFSGMDTTLLDKPINKLGELYASFVPTIDMSSKGTKEEIEKIKAAYYDVVSQQLNAKTEQDKAVANENYKVLQAEAEKALGYKLSDNANEAWTQLNSLGKSVGVAGLTGSGIAEEARNKYLQDIRKNDSRNRDATMTQEEQNKRSYYLNSASAEEIAALTPEEQQRYGLIPSAEIKQWFNKENLKSLYPDLTDAEIQRYMDSVIDPATGLYRSVLYQNLSKNQLENANEKSVYQSGKLYYDSQGNVTGGEGYIYQKYLENQKLMKPYTQGLYTPPENITPGATIPSANLPLPDITGNNQPAQFEYYNEPLPTLEQNNVGFGYYTNANPVTTQNNQQSYITQPTIDKYWEDFKIKNNKQDWSGYQAIATPTDIPKYTNVQNPGGKTLYGKLI